MANIMPACVECGVENEGSSVTCHACHELFVPATPAVMPPRLRPASAAAPPAAASPGLSEKELAFLANEAAVTSAPAPVPAGSSAGPAGRSFLPGHVAPATALDCQAPEKPAAAEEPEAEEQEAWEPEAVGMEAAAEAGCPACGNEFSMIRSGPPSTHFCGACGHSARGGAAPSDFSGAPSPAPAPQYGQLITGGASANPMLNPLQPAIGGAVSSAPPPPPIPMEEAWSAFGMELPPRSLCTRVVFLVLTCFGSVGIYFGCAALIHHLCMVMRALKEGWRGQQGRGGLGSKWVNGEVQGRPHDAHATVDRPCVRYNIIGATAPVLHAAPYNLNTAEIGGLAAACASRRVMFSLFTLYESAHDRQSPHSRPLLAPRSSLPTPQRPSRRTVAPRLFPEHGGPTFRRPDRRPHRCPDCGPSSPIAPNMVLLPSDSATARGD